MKRVIYHCDFCQWKFKNVIKATESAHKYEGTVIGFNSFDGFRLRSLANINIPVNSNSIEHVTSNCQVDPRIVPAIRKYHNIACQDASQIYGD